MTKDKGIIDIARQVIDDEVEALIGLKGFIDENFEEIIEVICLSLIHISEPTRPY